MFGPKKRNYALERSYVLPDISGSRLQRAKGAQQKSCEATERLFTYCLELAPPSKRLNGPQKD
jgi:hypothetical protein